MKLLLFFVTLILVATVSADPNLYISTEVMNHDVCDMKIVNTKIKIVNMGDELALLPIFNYKLISPDGQIIVDETEIITKVPKAKIPKAECFSIGAQYEVLNEQCLIKIYRELTLPKLAKEGIWEFEATVTTHNETSTITKDFEVKRCDHNNMFVMILVFIGIYLLTKYGGKLI